MHRSFDRSKCNRFEIVVGMMDPTDWVCRGPKFLSNIHVISLQPAERITQVTNTVHGASSILIRESQLFFSDTFTYTEYIRSIFLTLIALFDYTLFSVYGAPTRYVYLRDLSLLFRALGFKSVDGGDFDAKQPRWEFVVQGMLAVLPFTMSYPHLTSIFEYTYCPSDPNDLPDILDNLMITLV